VLFLTLLLANRHKYEVLKMYEDEKDVKLAAGMFGLILISMTFLACSLLSNPGYVERRNLSDNDNIVMKLCQEMDSNDA